MASQKDLVLLKERRFKDLFPKLKKFEASGVFHRNGYLYVVFDNLFQVGKIHPDLKTDDPRHRLLGKVRNANSGYEGITFNEDLNQFYTLVEALDWPDGTYRAHVHEYDTRFKRIGGFWLDFPFGKHREGGNKGFEGLCWLRHAGREYLLAVCEGNDCCWGKEGKKPGKGRIQVFEKRADEWVHDASATLKLPRSVDFKDYAGMGQRGLNLFVTSQASSKLWVGTLKPNELAFEDDGQMYRFPKKKGEASYCNVEGVALLPTKGHASRIVVVSDKRKKKQSKACENKDQSIHLFEFPPG